MRGMRDHYFKMCTDPALQVIVDTKKKKKKKHTQKKFTAKPAGDHVGRQNVQ